VKDKTRSQTRSSYIAEGPRDALWQSKSCQMAQTYTKNPFELKIKYVKIPVHVLKNTFKIRSFENKNVKMKIV